METKPAQTASRARRRRWLAAVLLVPVLVVAGIVGRLALGPTSLWFLAPRLETALEDVLPGWSARVDEGLLSLSVSEGLVNLDANSVQLDQPGGSAVLLPRVRITVQLAPMAKGRLKPVAIGLQSPEITLTLSSDDLARWVSGDKGGGPSLEVDGPASLDELAILMDDLNGGLSALDRIGVTDATVRLEDTHAGGQLVLAPVSLSLVRGARGPEISLSIAHVGKEVLSASLRRAAAPVDGWDLLARISDLRADQIFSDLPAAAPLSGVAVGLSAQITGLVNGDFQPQALRATIASGAGQLNLPGIYEGVRRIEGVDTTFEWQASDGLISLNSLVLNLPGLQLAGSGSARIDEDGLAGVSAQALIPAMTVADLKTWWPIGAAEGGRRWVDANIDSGQIRDVTLALALDREAMALRDMPAENFRLDFELDDIVAHVLRPMPPLQNGTATARLTRNALDIRIADGSIDGLPVGGSQVLLERLAYPKPQTAHIDLRVTGAVPHVLRVIDSQPLVLTSRFGLAPEQTEGDSTTRAILDFPLTKDLTLEEVAYDVTSEITELALPEMLQGRGVSDGQLSLAVRGSSLRANGDIRLAGIPVGLTWTEDFTPEEGAFGSRFDLVGTLSAEQLDRLGLDPGSVLIGQMGLRASFFGRGPDIAEGTVDLDLSTADVIINPLNWVKPAGQPATGQLDLTFKTDRVEISDLRLAAEHGEAQGQLLLGADGSLQRMRLDYFRSGFNDLSGVLTVRPDGSLEAQVDGRSIDLRAVLKDLIVPPPTEPGAEPRVRRLDRMGMTISVSADSVILLNEEEFGAVTMDLLRQDALWQSIRVRGAGMDGAAFALDLDGDMGNKNLRLIADDAGSVARGLGLFANAEGGRLSAEGIVRQRVGLPFSAEGEVLAEDVRIINSSTLEGVLAAAETQGFDGYVKDKGVKLDEVVLPFAIEDGIVDITDARANGPTIGLTLEGQIDDGLERVNVNGVIIPAYGINALLGKIPLVGGLFTGGKGEGLFAVTYRISGPTDDPTIAVNPLTALAPGILRNLFEGQKGTLPAEDPAQAGTAPDNPPPGRLDEEPGELSDKGN